jgi:hypothetical protein
MTWVYVAVGLLVVYLLFVLGLCRAAGRWDREQR